MQGASCHISSVAWFTPAGPAPQKGPELIWFILFDLSCTTVRAKLKAQNKVYRINMIDFYFMESYLQWPYQTVQKTPVRKWKVSRSKKKVQKKESGKEHQICNNDNSHNPLSAHNRICMLPKASLHEGDCRWKMWVRNCRELLLQWSRGWSPTVSCYWATILPSIQQRIQECLALL